MANLEGRIFFTVPADHSDSSIGSRATKSSCLDLAVKETVETIVNSASRMFNPEKNKTKKALEKIPSKMSESSAEHRNDLYLVLPASCAGNFIGLKWRGQTESLVPPSSSPSNETAETTKFVQKLLSSPLEVKISPVKIVAASNNTTSGNVAEIGDPEPVQFWSKFELRCIGGNVPKPVESAIDNADTNSKAVNSANKVNDPKMLRNFFANQLAQALFNVAKLVPVDSTMRTSLELAGRNVLEQQKFAIVSVDKHRRKLKFDHPDRDAITQWQLEQTDLVLRNVTPNFFGGAEKEVGLARTWCVEPSFSGDVGRQNAVACASDFLAASQLLISRITREVKIASYPQFLVQFSF